MLPILTYSQIIFNVLKSSGLVHLQKVLVESLFLKAYFFHHIYLDDYLFLMISKHLILFEKDSTPDNQK